MIGEYDKIELPPITLFVRRHRQVCVSCPHCRTRVKGDVPDAASGSPFGPRLHGLALYLKTYQSVSFARLAGMFKEVKEVFGVDISQGALANMLKGSHASFGPAHKEILETLCKADVVASDETSIRVEGINGYHWVFRSDEAVVHDI